jgi:asparagine synthase (glutamine-hydrolysing)
MRQGMRVLTAPLLNRFTSPKYAGLLEYGGSWSGAYLLRRALFMPWEIPQVLDPEIARTGWSDLHILPRLEATVSEVNSPTLRVSSLETAWYMRNQLLRDADWAGMAHSVEIRTPLADLELIRVVSALQARGKIEKHKRDMIKLPSKPLPSAVVERNKTGFAVPVRQWLSQVQCDSDDKRGLRSWAMRVGKEFNFDLVR